MNVAYFEQKPCRGGRSTGGSMDQQAEKCPIGVSTVMTQYDETVSRYMGLTREQKRDILTGALVGRAEHGALLRSEALRERK